MSSDSGSSACREHKNQRAVWGAVGALSLTLVGAESVSAQCQYEVTAVVEGPDCGALGHAGVHFFGINDYGQACGERGICGQVGATRPIVWTPEQGLITLPLPEGATRGAANDINNVLGSDGFGQVACTLSGGLIGGNKPYLYDDGVWTPLGLLPGSSIGEALAINDSTEIVGRAGGPVQAFIWRDGVMTALDLPIGPNRAAHDISQLSSVVGWMGDGGAGFSLGFLFIGGNVTDIPPIADGNNSEAAGVNIDDSVTGSSRIPVKSGPVGRRSWNFENGRLTDLGGFVDTHRNRAEDINDAGQIVGSCFDLNSAETSYLWQDDELIRLDDLFEMPPGIGGLTAVRAINNRGQIVGYTGGNAEGIILTPIVPLGDVNLDCQVNGDDLAIVLSDWGPDKIGHIADIVTNATFQPPGDGFVDGADLAVVLGNWTERSSSQQSRR